MFKTNSNEKLPLLKQDHEKNAPQLLSSSLERHGADPDILSISKVDFSSSQLMSPDSKKFDTAELNVLMDDEQIQNGSFLGYQSSSKLGHPNRPKSHAHSSSFDLYHRRQTPLRWSKRHERSKKKFNLSLTNNKSLVLRPKFKGKNLKSDLLSQQQQVEFTYDQIADQVSQSSFYNTGLTNEFETIKIGQARENTKAMSPQGNEF